MKNIIKTILLLGIVSTAFAGKYGMAGCGVGSLVLGDQPGKIQIAAALINDAVSYFTGVAPTWSMTTGTSNCSEDGVTLQSKEQDYFAEANFETLKNEMAQGQGENLAAFASLFGCSDKGSARFSATMQQNYQSIFNGAQDGTDMLVGVRGVFTSQMSSSCNGL